MLQHGVFVSHPTEKNMTKKSSKEKKSRAKKSSASARATAKATVKHGRDRIIVVQGASSSSGGGGAAASHGGGGHGYPVYQPPPPTNNQPPVVFFQPPPPPGPSQEWMEIHQRYTDAFERRLADRLNDTQDQLNHLHGQVGQLRNQPPPTNQPAWAPPYVDPHPPSFAPQLNTPMDMSASIPPPPPPMRDASVQAPGSVLSKHISVKQEDDMSDLSDEIPGGMTWQEASARSSVKSGSSVPRVDPTIGPSLTPGSSVISSVHMLGPGSVRTIDMPDYMDLTSMGGSSSSSSSKKPPSVKPEVKPEVKTEVKPPLVKAEDLHKTASSLTPLPPSSNSLVMYEMPKAIRKNHDSKRVAISDSTPPAIDMSVLESKSIEGSMASNSKASSSLFSPYSTDNRRRGGLKAVATPISPPPNPLAGRTSSLRKRLAALGTAQRSVQDAMRKHDTLPAIARNYLQNISQ